MSSSTMASRENRLGVVKGEKWFVIVRVGGFHLIVLIGFSSCAFPCRLVSVFNCE